MKRANAGADIRHALGVLRLTPTPAPHQPGHWRHFVVQRRSRHDIHSDVPQPEPAQFLSEPADTKQLVAHPWNQVYEKVQIAVLASVAMAEEPNTRSWAAPVPHSRQAAPGRSAGIRTPSRGVCADGLLPAHLLLGGSRFSARVMCA